MKKFNSVFLKFLILLLILAMLTACSSKSNDRGDMPQSSPEYTGDVADMDSGSDGEREEAGIPIGDKVISTYYMNLETLNFDKTRDDLEGLIKKYNGFIENSNIGFNGYQYSKNYRYGDFTIRIPKDNIEDFNLSLKDIGNITDESTNKDDVTKFYRDTESRLKLVTAKEKRLLELLEKAVKVEDIIAIESELTNTIYEKEMLERDLKSIDEKIDFTTLNLHLIEVRNFSNTERSTASLGERLKAAFKDSWFAFKLALENFFIWLVFALPYLIIIIPIIILLIFFIRRKRRKNKI